MNARNLSCTFIAAIIAIGPHGHLGASEVSPDSAILSLLSQMESESSPNARYEIAARLDATTRTVRDAPALTVSEATIARIASLLDDRLEIIRVCAAESLGNLGPRARVAVPALKSALVRAKRDREIQRQQEGSSRDIVFHSGPDTIVTIEASLQRIQTDAGPASVKPRREADIP